MIALTVNSDGVQAVLVRARETLRNPRPLLRAGGTTLVSLIQGNFSSHGSSYRPRPWADKKDGTPATLKRRGLLSGSFTLAVDGESATITNPTPYAAIHQFGGRTKPHEIRPRFKKALAFVSVKFGGVVVTSVQHPGSDIPARPFVPITDDGRLTPAAEEKVGRAMERALERELAKGGGA